MRIGVGGSQLDGGLIGCDGFLDAAGLVEHVAQVEVGERIARIDLDGRAVVALGSRIFLPVVVESAEIDVRGSVIGIHFQNLRIDSDGLVLCARFFFQGDPARKQLGNVGDDQFRSGTRRAGHYFFLSPEIKHELPGDRLHESSLMPKGNAPPALVGARFEQWIFHPGNLLQHGFERLPDHGWSHFLRAQVSHLLDLQQIEK